MPAESPATPTRPPVPSLAVSPTSPVYDSAAQDPSQDPVVHIPLWVGVLVRIVLFFYVGASGFFQERVETTTPVNGWKRFKEGLYLYQHGIPPYEGGVFHQAPLLLPVFTYLPPILVPILFISLDYAIARCLVAIAAHKRNLHSSDPTKPVDVLINPTDVGSMYLLNPLSVITCLSQSTLLFMFLAIVVALRQAIEGNRKTAVAGVAVAAYLGLYPVMMVVPVTLLLVGAKTKAVLYAVFGHALPLLVLYTSALLGLSYLLVGTWDFLNATYGVILFVPDLTPNIGLFWYFFTEMFDSFRTFFLCVFQIMAFAFVIPIGLVLRDHPLFIAYVYTGIMAVFKSYPTVGDTALFLAFFSMHREVHKYMRHLYITATALFIALLLGPLFHHLWIYAGSGNANFFYAITLVFNLAVVVCLTDSVGALGIREWERTHGEGRRGRWVLVHK
ncbi:GPI transamidase subunit PIG-U [Fimicolochytrium jonesii]|uniref:GPI transamidase subunit PIG-U n=1 Tax=Fimicolochytrium jonesii TaxID=1396493 RepID=UPI0022FE8C66|nr:GPI transamidase subunit PIG-U [Fimicolochytrium jonesii]KAI8826249.1 GPI transamidase subunit PIG-U [Fimicolochytrium jonesii]